MNRKELFLISLSIFLTIFAWLLFDIYRITKKTEEIIKNDHMIKSLKVIKLEKDVLEQLKKREILK